MSRWDSSFRIPASNNKARSPPSSTSTIPAYFRDLTAVRDHISKAQFYEHESDKLAEKIKRTVFKMDIELSHKIHIRYFVSRMETIADRAEDVCDRLSIATIKRYL